MWLTEDALSPAICLFAGACGAFAVWRSRRTTGYLGVAVGLVLVAAALFPIEHHIVTEQERIEILLTGVADAALANDEQRLLSFVSEQARDLRSLVSNVLAFVRVEDDLRFTDVSVRVHSQDSRAIAHLRANGTVTVEQLGRAWRPSRWELSWRREAGNWKIAAIRRLHVVSGQEMGLPERR